MSRIVETSAATLAWFRSLDSVQNAESGETVAMRQERERKAAEKARACARFATLVAVPKRKM